MVSVAEPLLPPLHETFVWLVVTERRDGSVIRTDAVVTQFNESVTVTVQVPAGNPVAVAVAVTVGSFHKKE